MSTVTYAGTNVTVNDEGFFLDSDQWTGRDDGRNRARRRHRRR